MHYVVSVAQASMRSAFTACMSAYFYRNHDSQHTASMYAACMLALDTHHSPDSVSTAPLIMVLGRYKELLCAWYHADMSFSATNKG